VSDRLTRLREMRAWIDHEILEEVQSLSTRGADMVLARCAALYGVQVEDVVGGCRKQQEVRARQAAAWLFRRGGLSSPLVGAILGCDHTTVLYAQKKIDASPSTKALLLGLEVVA
jgi:chromosomal replication initiation ATPase DnaA